MESKPQPFFLFLGCVSIVYLPLAIVTQSPCLAVPVASSIVLLLMAVSMPLIIYQLKYAYSKP